MSRRVLPVAVIGNEFIVPGPSLQRAVAAAPVPAPAQTMRTPVAPVLDSVTMEFEEVSKQHQSYHRQLFELFHRYSVGAFAIMLLILGAAAVGVVGDYESAKISIDTTEKKTGITRILTQPKRGPNSAVLSAQAPAQLQQIISQPVNLTIGTKQVAVPAETVKSWVKAVPDKKQGVTYLHVSETSVAKSLEDIAKSHFKTPVDQVAVPQSDGSSRVIVAGRNGSKVGDTKVAANQIANDLFSTKGFQLALPVEPVAFAALTPANFDKMLEVNIASKQMWAYEKGQLVNSWPISAGAPDTPTPIGQFKIYSKLTIQDMRGFNSDGSRYFQPNVRWVNYFLPGGYAVHGNYWRPLSWFGAINSSHGCVSLPDNQAKWVYDWAPIGTTVITHT